MVQPAEDEGLAAKACARGTVTQRLGVEHLDGDIALQPHVPCAVHDAHAASADLLGETEMTENLPGREGRRRHIESYDGSGPRSTQDMEFRRRRAEGSVCRFARGLQCSH